MDKQKALVILTPGFPANEADTTCMPFPQLFVKTLHRSSASLRIVVIAFQYPFVSHTYTWNGVHVIALNGQNKGKWHRLAVWKSAWDEIRQLVQAYRVIGFLSFWLGECALIGKYAAKKYKQPCFTWLLGQDARPGNRYAAWVKPGAQNLLALSDFLAKSFYENYGIKPAHIVAPGVDPDCFIGGNQQRNIDVLGAGSLIPLKQYDVFIEVIAAIRLRFPAIRAVICGKGPERERLQRLIDEANLSVNIQLYGELDHPDLLSLMERSFIFLHPSSYEGFATVLNEALYAGNEVVCFCRPMDTIFTHQHVVTTKEAMIETLAALLTNKRQEPGRVLTNHIDSTCRKMLSLYALQPDKEIE